MHRVGRAVGRGLHAPSDAKATARAAVPDVGHDSPPDGSQQRAHDCEQHNQLQGDTPARSARAPPAHAGLAGGSGAHHAERAVGLCDAAQVARKGVPRREADKYARQRCQRPGSLVGASAAWCSAHLSAGAVQGRECSPLARASEWSGQVEGRPAALAQARAHLPREALHARRSRAHTRWPRYLEILARAAPSGTRDPARAQRAAAASPRAGLRARACRCVPAPGPRDTCVSTLWGGRAAAFGASSCASCGALYYLHKGLCRSTAKQINAKFGRAGCKFKFRAFSYAYARRHVGLATAIVRLDDDLYHCSGAAAAHRRFARQRGRGRVAA